MSIVVIEPKLTRRLAYDIFSSLSFWEFQKNLDINYDLNEGAQTGYIECLSHLFGRNDDDKIDEAFDEGATWIQVIIEIIRDKEVVLLKESLEKETDDWDTNYDTAERVIKEATIRWVDENAELAFKAIRNI